ncbi:MAG: A24 family peptidase [Planctomycetes bacterium]|nr:A24 family peptidase [Planctomycetota bacterium]
MAFWTAVGLCLGSFLNVVIYRLPRYKSLRSPLWSACPSCEHRIRWYDNLPIASFISLGGKCRDCGAPIGTRYMVVEAAMAIVVLMLIDAFFIGQVRLGLSGSQFGLTDQFSYDWPLLTAHVILFACLISMAAIDLEHYWLDVRFTNLATIAGFVLHALWTPRHSVAWTRPSDTLAVMALFAMVGLGLTWIAFLLRPPADPDVAAEPEAEFLPSPADSPPASSENDQDAGGDGHGGTSLREVKEPAGAESGETLPVEPTAAASGLDVDYLTPPAEPLTPVDDAEFDEVGASTDEPSGKPRTRFLGWALTTLLVALFALLLLTQLDMVTVGAAFRLGLPLALFFVVIICESTVARPADREIVDAIFEERFGARRMVLVELANLLPAIALAVVGLWIMQGDAGLSGRFSDALHASTRIWNVSLFREWAPLYGLATAASGYVVAGALGWAVRIIFTLILGKEAFGTGDIHVMAAAGCIAGWPVVVLGFFAAVLLALLGVIISLPFKRARAIPLVPWLALGFLFAVVAYDAILGTTWGQNFTGAMDLLISKISQLLGVTAGA